MKIFLAIVMTAGVLGAGPASTAMAAQAGLPPPTKPSPSPGPGTHGAIELSSCPFVWVKVHHAGQPDMLIKKTKCRKAGE